MKKWITRTGTKIVIGITICNFLLTAFLITIGLIKYGNNAEYWQNVAEIIKAINSTNVFALLGNEARKTFENIFVKEGGQ